MQLHILKPLTASIYIYIYINNGCELLLCDRNFALALIIGTWRSQVCLRSGSQNLEKVTHIDLTI
jgi:hypothetical protein